MSRAFGDCMLKQFVVAEPEIQELVLNDEHELLVLASNSLWDVVPNEDAVKIGRKEEEVKAAARKLTETAFNRGSADNITCIVVRFHHHNNPKVDQAEPKDQQIEKIGNKTIVKLYWVFRRRMALREKIPIFHYQAFLPPLQWRMINPLSEVMRAITQAMDENGEESSQLAQNNPMEVTLQDIAPLPILPQVMENLSFHSDPLVFAFSEPITNPQLQAQTNIPPPFSPALNGPELLDPQDVPDPHSIQDINNQLAHMEHFGLVIRLVDLSDNISSTTIISRLSDVWKGLQGEVSVDELGNSWVLFQFETREARDIVWQNRPYHVQGKLLVVVEYERKFDPFSFNLRIVDMWVRVPFLPFYLQSEQALTMIIKGNQAGIFLRVDESSNIKNRRKFARLCMSTNFPNPPRFLHFKNHDNSVLSFEIWYEGFSPGCGCCGDPHHSFEECFLHNLQPIAFEFSPTRNEFAAENARQTKMRMLQNLLATHTISPRPIKGPSFKKKSSATASQKKIEAFHGHSSSKGGVSPSPARQGSDNGINSNRINHSSAMAEQFPHLNKQIVPYNKEKLAKKQTMAQMMSNSLYKTASTTSPRNASEVIANQEEVEKNKDEGNGNQYDKEGEEASPPKSKNGKEKVVDSGVPHTKKRKNSNKNGVLRITG